MAKKKIDQKVYINKEGIGLLEAEKFIYEMTVLEYMKDGVCLVDSKQTEIKEFKGFDTSKIIEKQNKRFLQSVDLIAAPIKFLEKNNFKILE